MAAGDSVSRVSVILVNPPAKVDLRPAIYAMTLNREALVRRLTVTSSDQDGSPTSVLLGSDNPACPPRALTGDHLRDLRTAGRVRGVFAFV